ncbi:UNVERIFIED_CONTAM: DDB1- and CUL4-associated factor 11 [Siphonaria sp. JEL0065]|nr:DDB1- and CUL4-associated factor 11 [Siphonaria sp. JEL0065]
MQSDDSDSDWIDEDEDDDDLFETEQESGAESGSDGESAFSDVGNEDPNDVPTTPRLTTNMNPPKLPKIFHYVNTRHLKPISVRAKQALLAQFLPNPYSSRNSVWKEYEAKPYCAQFSYDGATVYSATQDFKIHLYNAHNDFASIATINAVPGRWTITDCDMSKDSRSLLYSSIHSTIYFVNLAPFVGVGNSDCSGITDDSSSHIPLSMGEHCGIWSIRLSDDGKEVVAGASEGLIFVYDVEYNRVVHRVQAHNDDVNAVTFADQSSNLLLSGSDDGLIKVWDRRSSLHSNTPAGILPGHTEGITFISTRGRDGRTAVSNAKDQTLKVWDLRNMVSPSSETARVVSRMDYGTGFDYRWQPYPLNRRVNHHPHDVSVATFKGHSVLRTLIRCHYSPESTGYRYLYSGSADGCVYIYDPVLNPTGGDPIHILNTAAVRTTQRPMTHEEEELVLQRFAPDDREMTPVERAYLLRLLRQRQRQRSGRETCVRDVTWNPNCSQLVASVWKGEEGGLESFEFGQDFE